MRTSRSRLAALALPALLAGPGCVTGGLYRERAFEPVAPATLAALEPGRATLAEALERLGAPLFVWEWRGDGAALAWGWRDARRWGFSISVPLDQGSNASFSYDDLARELPGAVLFFDPEGKLVEARQGKLAEIEAATRRTRPAPPVEAQS